MDGQYWVNKSIFILSMTLNEVRKEFKMLKKFENQNKGITLIMLVIT